MEGRENLSNESWRPVVGFEELYMVSNKGRVKSIARTVLSKRWGQLSVSERILNLNQKKNGYIYCVLSKDGEPKSLRVHRLVAQCFLPNPENLPVVNHKDGVKNNNNLSNLEWCTNQENDLHKTRVLGKQTGAFNSASKQVVCLSTGMQYDTLKMACCDKGLDYKKSSSILTGKRNGHIDLAYV